MRDRRRIDGHTIGMIGWLGITTKADEMSADDYRAYTRRLYSALLLSIVSFILTIVGAAMWQRGVPVSPFRPWAW